MNPVLSELHATARRGQFLAEAERRRLAHQARVQRSTRVGKADSLSAVVSWLGLNRKGLGAKGRVVEARAA
jgi:hypothetical protein